MSPATDTPIETLARQVATSMSVEWRAFARLAFVIGADRSIDAEAIRVAEAARCGIESVKRKLRAIQHCMTLGFTEDEIVSMGQEKVLGQHQQNTRERKYTAQVSMGFRVQGSQKELVLEQISRVREVLNLDGEQFWDFFISVWSRVGTEELNELAGGGGSDGNMPASQNR